MNLSKEANERLWEAFFKESLEEDMKREILEDEEKSKGLEPHVFSDRFIKQMNKNIRMITRQNRTRKFKAFVKAIPKIILGILSVSGFGVMFLLIASREVSSSIIHAFLSAFGR